MTDFLSTIIGAAGPVEREVTIAGKSGPVFLRYLNGEQRLQLTKGRKFNVRKGENPIIEVDLGENEAEKHKLILFCVCDAAGKSRFKDANEVKALAGHVIDALADAVQQFNKEAFGEDKSPGES